MFMFFFKNAYGIIPLVLEPNLRLACRMWPDAVLCAARATES